MTDKPNKIELTDAQRAALMDALLRCRAPRTKEELWWYCKLRLRVTCEVCKGAKQYLGPDGMEPCAWCGGEGVHGFHVARVAVCDGHDAPLDALWKIWSGELHTAMWIAVRGGGKTRLDAVIEHLLARFKRFSISHMGGSANQADRCRAHMRAQTDGDPTAPFGYLADTREPAPQGLPGWVPELVKDLPEKMEWANGATNEFLPGTMAQASGPHPEFSCLDEVDETTPEVEAKFASTPTGPRSVYLLTSTHTYATGTVSGIRKKKPYIPVFTWCLLESIQRCTHDCDKAPLPEKRTGRCPLFETEEVSPDGRLEKKVLCGGVLCRKSDGHIPVATAIESWLRVEPYWRSVELLCRAPQMGMGAGIAYWAYSPENDLPFDPPVQPGVPLEWTHDFNPGMDMKMCSLVIQQAPPEYPGEFWVIDEIVLQTSNTPAVVAEFSRRYAGGGSMVPFLQTGEQFRGGLWIYGDRSGHTPTSTSTDTDYQLLCRSFEQWQDFRLCIPYGATNPPIAERMVEVNTALWNSLTGRRTLRFAPRCVNARDEMARLPLKPGTREKDKSAKVQKMGLTHASDALDYWVWTRLKGQLAGNVAGQLGVAGPRASADGGALFALQAGGRRASAEGPWGSGNRGGRDDGGWRR